MSGDCDCGRNRRGRRECRHGTRMRLTYDAWNRPTQVESWKDANANGVQDEGEDWGLVAVYQYDGQGRRIAKIVRQVDGEEVTYQRTDYLYNEQWQVLEERADPFDDLEGEGGARETPAETPNVQWLWDIRYIDAPVLRWRSVSGTLDEVLYVCNDANMNVTALIDPATGEVVERYVYDAYGKATFYDDSWNAVSWEDSKQNNVLYCGYRFDPETGLYQVRRRYYHPTLGRWVTRDPRGYVGRASLYDYGASTPATSTDPAGAEPVRPMQPATGRMNPMSPSIPPVDKIPNGPPYGLAVPDAGLRSVLVSTMAKLCDCFNYRDDGAGNILIEDKFPSKALLQNNLTNLSHSSSSTVTILEVCQQQKSSNGFGRSSCPWRRT